MLGRYGNPYSTGNRWHRISGIYLERSRSGNDHKHFIATGVYANGNSYYGRSI